MLFCHVHTVASITGKVLIAAVTGQRHGDPLARGLADAVGRHRRAVGEGFVEQPSQPVDQREVVGLHRVCPVVGVIALGDLQGIRGLVELGDVETDRTGLDRLIDQPRHQCNDGAGIHTAGQERPQWHLGHQADVDRLAQPPDQFALRAVLRRQSVVGERNVPVLIGSGEQGLALLDQQGMAGRKFAHAREYGPGFRDIAVGEVVLDRHRVALARQCRVWQQGLEFRTEHEVSVG